MKVSVCMAVHNGAKYLRQQIDSILIQLSQEDELIISDDGSTDNSLSLIKSYNDPRILLFSSPFKNNPIKNFENALSHSSGNYIFLSDQDDVWLPNKIEIMTKALHYSDLILCDCILVDNTLKQISPSLYKLHNTKTGIISNIIKNGYIGCCMAFKKKVLAKAMPFPSNIPMHDQWIGIVAERFFQITHISDKLVQYRRHSDSTTNTGIKSHYSIASKLRFRYFLVKEILKLFYE